MKLKALRAGDAHSHEDEECRKRSTLRFGRCLTSATGAQQRARRENVPRHILSYFTGNSKKLPAKLRALRAGTHFFYIPKNAYKVIDSERSLSWLSTKKWIQT